MRPPIEPFPRTASIWQSLAVVPRQPPRAGHNEIARDRKLPPCVYDDFDLWLSLEGRSTVEILGRTLPFDAGMSLLLPPGITAIQRVTSEAPHHVAYFHFDIAYRGKILRDARRYVKAAADAPLALTLPGLPSLALFAPLDTSRLAEHLLRAARRWDNVAQLQSQSLVMGALAEHCREALQPAGGRRRAVSVVDAALQYLEDHLQQPLFVAGLARHLRLSPSHLTRLFRQQLKETPIQALIRMRLMRAQHLLRDPALNISEVATACGFESLSYFTRVFAEKYGRPPTAYRRGFQRSR